MRRFIFIIQILTLSTLSLFAQKEIITPYNFPITPNSKEWREISSSKEMLTVCQIPDDILKKLSSNALAETCLNYPLFFEYTASNDERAAIEIMIQNFNGLRELSKRENGLSELINLYEELPVKKKITSKRSTDEIPYKTMYIELVLANHNFINKASDLELQTLKKVLRDKYNDKLHNLESYSLYNIRKTLLLGAVVHLKQNSSRNTKSVEMIKIESFVQNFNSIDKQELSIISKILMK